MKIDIYNILTAIRCKAEAVPPEDIKELIIPIYTELDSKVLERGIDSDDVTEATNILEDSTYGKPLSKARKEYEETGSIFPFERELKEFLLRKLRTLSIQHYTGVGPLLAFFQEKDTEVKNLTTILNGKAEGLESEEIKEKLVTPGVEI